jgi:hypothetical protein
MLTGSCHCGAAGWTLEGDPGAVTACNCTLCRRYGALWAYDYEGARIHLTGESASYARADMAEPELEIRFCPRCAGVVAWRGLSTDAAGRRRIAVNMRLAEPQAVGALPIRRFEGLVTFKDLPADGRCVRHLWF